METNPEKKIYSAGYAGTVNGGEDFSAEYSAFYEKEPDGTVGASNVYVLARGTDNSYLPEVGARFTAKKILYEYFHSYDFVDANKLALAMRTANNEIFEYAKVQNEVMSASAISAAVTDGKVVIGNVGSGRAYIIRNDKVFQITEAPTPDEDGNIPEPELLGQERDLTIDVYDGIDVRDGDVFLLCSASLDTFVGKSEILYAVESNGSPRGIVRAILELPSVVNAGVCASAAAIRIYGEENADSIQRVDAPAPEDTDLNLEKKDIEIMRQDRQRRLSSQKTKASRKDNLPKIILGTLLAILLIAGGIYAFTASKNGSGFFGLSNTPTATPDHVRETMTVLELTVEAEKQASVQETVAAWPTQTPYPTFTPEFIDLGEGDAESEAVTAEGDETIEVFVSGEDAADESVSVEAAEAVVEPTEAPTAIPTLAPVPTKEPMTEEKSGAEMVYVPAGNFLLGSDPEKDAYAYEDEESPQMQVYLSAFWIGKTEVTNAEYLKCVEAGICEMNYYMSLYTPGYENYPVVYVTEDQAERYCSWIGGRLPTEYEWEKAARGTDGRIYPWGDEIPDNSNALANIPGYVDEEGNGNDLFAVGSFPKGASPYGALDMAGNVWEWTNTWYSVNYYQTLAAEEELAESIVSDPTGPEMGSAYVIRGGSCANTEINNYESYMRAANRSYINMSSSYYIGFRCVIPDNMVETVDALAADAVEEAVTEAVVEAAVEEAVEAEAEAVEIEDLL